MKFDKDPFQGELKLKLQSINLTTNLLKLFLSVFNKHTPLTKTFVRGIQVPYMTKQLRKVIMRASQLENILKIGLLIIKLNSKTKEFLQ